MFPRDFNDCSTGAILLDSPMLAVPTSTTRLDTSAFVEYTEKCRVWANEFLGLQIPLPGEQA